jgi:hypothetical protein
MVVGPDRDLELEGEGCQNAVEKRDVLGPRVVLVVRIDQGV